MLKFEFSIDKSGPKPTVREAMAFDPSSRERIWIKFEHEITTGSFRATSPKFPTLKVSGKNFEDCLTQFQKAYELLISPSQPPSG